MSKGVHEHVVLSRTWCSVRWRCCGRRRENRLCSVVLRGQTSWPSWLVVGCSVKLIDGGRAPPLPSLSPRVGLGVRVRVGLEVGLGLLLVYLVLEHEVLGRRRSGLDHMTKYCVLFGSPPLLVEGLACRHVGQDKLLFKNAALYVKNGVETFISVKVMGNYVPNCTRSHLHTIKKCD